jgi:hypothetical protein
LPEKEPTGDVGVTAGRSEAEEGEGLDSHQGQRPCPSTISLKVSRKLRLFGCRLCRKRDGGSRLDEVAGSERTLLAEAEGWKREHTA